MAHLTLNFLGQFHATCNDRQLSGFESNKVRALFAYLAVEASQAQPREQLATLLWPGFRDESARGSLRHALHQLRQTLAAAAGDNSEASAWLVSSRSTIQFNVAAPYTLDVHTFTTLLQQCANHPHSQLAQCEACLTRLQQAVESYRGEFLAGLAIDDSAPFEEWRRLKQEVLHVQALAALEQLATAYEARGNHELAHAYALRQLELEPWREEAHRRIMRSLVYGGQRNAALVQYRTCRQVLMKELGIEPDILTVGLYEQIRASGNGAAQGAAEHQLPGKQAGGILPTDPPPHAINLQPTPLPGSSTPVTARPVSSAGWSTNVASPLLGRELQLQALAEKVLAPENRLVTLIGLGGVGKTRLALSLAQSLNDKSAAGTQVHPFADGVFVVPLAGISADSADVAATISQAILQALQINLNEKVPANEQLLYVLRAQSMLVVLDNFEHLLVARGFVQTLLQGAPQLHLLITSRARLNLPGETVVRLDGLAVPPQDNDPDAIHYSSVQLFLAHVRRTWQAFVCDAETLPFVVRICRIVQGMPLGIELAAYWVRHFTCAEIGQTLQENLTLLENTTHPHPDRHHTLYAVFESSWFLLTPAEQHLLVCLSLFQGAFSRNAALTVSGATLRDLASLADKSLLQQSENPAFAGWYSLHELVRQFAAEKLAQSEPEARVAAQQRYVNFYMQWISSRTNVFKTAQQASIVAELQHEQENCRQAWTLAVGHGWLEALLGGLNGFVYFWRITGRLAEGEAMMASATQALATSHHNDGNHNSGNPRLLLRQANVALWLERANLIYLQNRLDEAFWVAKTAVKLAEANNQPVELIRALLTYADTILYGRNASIDYTTTAERALAVARQHHLRYWEGKALITLATEHNRLDQQIALINTALAIAHEENELELEISARSLLAGSFENHGQYAKALVYRQQIVQQAKLQPNPRNLAIALSNYAGTHQFLGCYSTALTLWQQALAVAQQHFLEWIAIHIREEIANLYKATGQIEQAYQQIVALRNELKGNPAGLAVIDFRYASILASHGDLEEALQVALRLVARLRIRLANQPTYLLPNLNLLAEIYHRAGTRAEAMRVVEEILSILATHPNFAMRDVTFDLFPLYLNVYEILREANDSRAASILQEGYEKLQGQAAKIEDLKLRRAFLEDMRANRQFMAYYNQWQARVRAEPQINNPTGSGQQRH